VYSNLLFLTNHEFSSLKTEPKSVSD